MINQVMVVFVVLVLSAAAGLQAEEKEKVPAAVYAEQCAFCHGASGAGDGPAASMLSPRPTNFSAVGYWDGADSDKLATTILKGKAGTPMVPFEGTISAQQAKALVEYLRKLGR